MIFDATGDGKSGGQYNAGNGIDIQNDIISAKLSSDSNNAISFGSDNGIYLNIDNKADLINGQVPYNQTPHLTGFKTIYVSPSGNDTNPGTQEAPFRSIQAAVDSLPKDLGKYDVTIRLEPGEYDGVKVNGFWGGTITIVGDGDNKSKYQVAFVTTYCSPMLKVRGVSLKYAIAQVSQIVELERVAFDLSGKEKTEAILAYQSTVSLLGVDFQNCPTCVNSARGSILYAGGCTGSGNTIGLDVSLHTGYPGLALLSGCTFGATTEIKKNYNSIVFADGELV